jgi:hypothetical protein
LEKYLVFFIKEMYGKRALKGSISWGHGKAWKKAYTKLVKRYRWRFPKELKTRDIKEYGY